MPSGRSEHLALTQRMRRASWTLAVVIVGLVGALAVARIVRQRSNAQERENRVVTRLALVAELAVTSRENALHLALITGDTSMLPRAASAGQRARIALDSLAALVEGDDDERRSVGSIDSAIMKWEREFAAPVTSGVLHPGEASLRQLLVRETDEFDAVRERFSLLTATLNDRYAHRLESLSSVERGTGFLFMGGSLTLMIIAFQLMWQLRKQTAFATHSYDRIEQQNAELQQLADRSRQLNRRLAEAQGVAQLGYWEIDSATGDVFWSDEMYRLCGIEPGILPVPTEHYLNCVHPDDRARMQRVATEAVENLREFTEQYRLRGADGKLQTVLAKGRTITDGEGHKKLIGTVQNVSDRVLLEQQLRQSQKMEAVGTLAGGVAHDFNNVLTVIMSYAGIVLSDLKPEDRGRNELREIHRAAERAAELTRQLLVFSRQQVVQTRRLSVNATVTELERMLRRLIPENITLATRLADDLAAVDADPGQLEQVLVNLVVNARDAMPDGGSLTIETSNTNLEPSKPPLSPDGKAGPYVVLSVSDTGMGMPESVRSRIFEPFFTTKEVGKGTGLGLATVYGIIQGWRGHIWVYSEVGVGSTFKIYLPAAGSADSLAAAPSMRARVQRGTETILLVEDEPAVRKATRTILQQVGYTVLEATDGEAALAVFRGNAERVDLVMTDMIMPGMNGRELADRLRAIRRDVRILFTSGYTDDSVLRRSLIEPGTLFIQKPFSFQALSEKVREAFGGSPPTDV